MILEKVERCVRALERIADSLERLNRAALVPQTDAGSGNRQIYQGQPNEVPEFNVHVSGYIDAGVEGFVATSAGDR